MSNYYHTTNKPEDGYATHCISVDHKRRFAARVQYSERYWYATGVRGTFTKHWRGSGDYDKCAEYTDDDGNILWCDIDGEPIKYWRRTDEED